MWFVFGGSYDDSGTDSPSITLLFGVKENLSRFVPIFKVPSFTLVCLLVEPILMSPKGRNKNKNKQEDETILVLKISEKFDFQVKFEIEFLMELSLN